MTPPLGLLLDVDGPISSTRTRTLRLAALADDLTAIARSGCPVVFNTGRSADFLGEQIIPRLVLSGLAPTDPVWGIGEKGGTWFSLVDQHGRASVGPVSEDQSMSPPAALIDASREIAERFSDIVYFDATKRTMISLEQHVDVPSADFHRALPEMVAEVERQIERTGAHDMTIYPTFISVDVEHARSGKALGARRALDLMGTRLEAPLRWFTAGDSGQDYDMATELHGRGFDVTHLDVRLSGDARDEPFRVIREVPDLAGGNAEDDITAYHVHELRAELRV
ncbi:MAG TPA: hypothetical protein H9800_03805 [Candidatus Microbacterium stercoravium]|uniref:Uncharacterized protein n=1 Tax=Candidatus Microbacterium stercoravium TaxID=2838697 RepID=A0A9D2H536_9MICO|nr:hypothetical protein [Candidatus Microbacterium stercoravium]